MSNYCRHVALYYRHYGRFYLDVVILKDPASFDYNIDWNNLFIFIKISRTYLIGFFQLITNKRKD